CATPTPRTRSTGARRSTWCRTRSGTPASPRPAATCTPGRPTRAAATWRCDGAAPHARRPDRPGDPARAVRAAAVAPGLAGDAGLRRLPGRSEGPQRRLPVDGPRPGRAPAPPRAPTGGLDQRPAGAGSPVIARQTGHKSLAVLHRYIRTGSLFRGN